MKRTLLIILLLFLMISVGGCKNKNKNNEQPNKQETVTYTIMFNGNGGTLVSGNEIQKVTKASEIVAPTFEKDGYIFKGFDKDLSTLSADTLVNALWDAIINYYTVTFNPNGGTLVSGNLVQSVTSAEDIVAPTFEKDGYIFKGFDIDLSSITGTTTVNVLWEEQSSEKYNIKFNLDGGISSNTLTKEVSSLDVENFFFDVTKENYNFRGWSYNGKTIYDENGNLINNAVLIDDMTFTAVYSKTVKLDIISNMQDAGMLSTTGGEYPFNSLVSVFVIPYEGYEFKGWYYNNLLLSTQKNYSYQFSASDVTLEARFALASYDLNIYTYDSELGIVSINFENNPTFEESKNAVVEYTNNVTIAAQSKTDVEFAGWFNENGELVSTNIEYTFTMPNYNYTLAAKWNHFTINYNLNGGTNDSNNPTTYTKDDAIDLQDATMTGYLFEGWYDNDAFDGEPIISIKKGTNKNFTLFAKFSPAVYKIIYDTPEDTICDESQDVHYKESYVLTIPTRKGYTFEGWYIDSTEFVSGVWTFLTDQTFTAKWTINTYDITYILNDGTDQTNPDTYTVEDQITLQPLTKTGYTFNGWFDNDAFSGNPITTIQKGSTENYTFYAKFTPNEYQIIYNTPSDTIGVSNQTITYGSTYTLVSPKRLGYTFDGWYIDSVQYQTGTWEFLSDQTFTASWSVNIYEVFYVMNGGEEGTANPTSYTVEEQITLQPLTKTGYTFDGWYNNVTFKGAKITELGKSTANDLTLYAKFTPNTYQIIYDTSIDTIGAENETVTYDSEYVLATPTRNGYTFNGWYIGHDKYTTGTWNFDSDQTFKAVWSINTYNITYTLNEGTNHVNNPDTYNVENDITLESPTLYGYTFEGWYEDSSFNGDPVTTIAKGSTGDKSLYAKWSLTNFNITYVLSNGTNDDSNPSTYTIFDEVVFANASKTNYIFKGWYTDSSFKTRIKTIELNSIGDLTLYAKFNSQEQELWDIAHGIIPTISNDGKTLTFGMYPQALVSDSSLVQQLNALDTSYVNSQGYYLYNGEYYYPCVANTEYSNTFENGTVVVDGTMYWFKAEAITWNILKTSDGNYKLLSNMLLDAMRFDDDSNNYKESEVRAFLNSDFYNMAFNDEQKALIHTILIDNSVKSSGYAQNLYVCEDTDDKVCLLSHNDIVNTSYGFDSNNQAFDPARQAKVTDYAVARGAYYCTDPDYLRCGEWWLRSPSEKAANYICYIFDYGFVYDDVECYWEDYCLRPSITMFLD